MTQKVFLIGLDGATFDLIRPWASQGHLPVLQRLIETGVSGDLRSTYPPLTGPAWSSFITGKSPGRHGILEFFRRPEGSYRQTLNNRYDIAGKSLWRLLSEGDQRVGVMGVPLTYPPEPVNGFLITGLLTPAGRRDFTYPPELLDELEDEIGVYRVRHDEKYRKSDPWPFIREQYEILDNNTQAAEYLMTHKPWDFMMVHILGTDRIQHEFWHVIDPAHPQHDPAEREEVGELMLDFFKAVDSALGRLIDLAPEAAVILMSDHGFGPVHKFINLNTWLIQQGLLRLKPSLSTCLRYLLFRMGLNYSVLGHYVLKLGFGKQAVQMGRARREELQRKLFLSLDDVDWSQSRVYSMGNFGQLYANLKGREPNGIVSPGEEYQALLDDLIGRLRSLHDPETGQPVVEEIFRGEDVYEGPYAGRAPDLMYFTRNMEYKAMGLSDFSSPKVFEAVYGTTGHHRMNGILICHGAGVFKQNEIYEGASIEDLAPTILYMMGQAIPKEMDGKILSDLFTPEFRANRKLEYIQEGDFESEEVQKELTEREEAELASVLRSLGYVT